MKKVLIVLFRILSAVTSLQAQHLKKDGTPDMRFKENKEAYGTSISSSTNTTPSSYNSPPTTDHLDLISRLKKEFDFDDIKLVTYEELLDKHVRLCNRLNEFNIFK